MRGRNASNLETLGQEQPPQWTQTGDWVHAELQRRASENGSDRKTLLTFSLGKQTPKSDQEQGMCEMTNHLQNTSQAGSMWQRTHREKGSALQAMYQNQRETQKEGRKKENTLRSRLSRCKSSAPLMSWRMKISLYSPKLSRSSQAATSSVPQFWTTKVKSKTPLISTCAMQSQSRGWPQKMQDRHSSASRRAGGRRCFAKLPSPPHAGYTDHQRMWLDKDVRHLHSRLQLQASFSAKLYSVRQGTNFAPLGSRMQKSQWALMLCLLKTTGENA